MVSWRNLWIKWNPCWVGNLSMHQCGRFYTNQWVGKQYYWKMDNFCFADDFCSIQVVPDYVFKAEFNLAFAMINHFMPKSTSKVLEFINYFHVTVWKLLDTVGNNSTKNINIWFNGFVQFYHVTIFFSIWFSQSKTNGNLMYLWYIHNQFYELLANITWKFKQQLSIATYV